MSRQEPGHFRDLTYPPIIAAAKTAFRILGQRITMTGTEHIPRTGGALLAVNHISYVDFVYAGLAAQPSKRLVRFMAKQEVFEHGVGGRLMRSMHHIAVDREAGTASFREAVRYLKAGEVVGIFPEATVSRALEIKELKSGAIRIAASAKVPIIPVIVWGTQRFVPKGRPHDLTRGRSISLRVGAPHYPKGGTHSDEETAALKAAMVDLLDQSIKAYPPAEQPPGSWWLPARYGGGAPTLAEARAIEDAEREARIQRRRERGEID